MSIPQRPPSTGLSSYRQYDERTDIRQLTQIAARMPTPHQLYDAAVALKNQGDLPGAIAKLREVLAIDPNHADTHCALAVYLQKTGQNDVAIQHALKVVELQPNDPFSYTQLSTVCMRCGQIPQAEAALARAREIQGGHCH